MRISRAKQLLHKKAGSPLYGDPALLIVRVLFFHFFIFHRFSSNLVEE